MAAFTVLLLLSVHWVSARSVNRLVRQSGSGDTAIVQFTLLSNYMSSCLEGLTPEGTSIHVDYRLIPIDRSIFIAGDWTRAHSIVVNSTGEFAIKLARYQLSLSHAHVATAFFCCSTTPLYVSDSNYCK